MTNIAYRKHRRQDRRKDLIHIDVFWIFQISLMFRALPIPRGPQKRHRYPINSNSGELFKHCLEGKGRNGRRGAVMDLWVPEGNSLRYAGIRGPVKFPKPD